VIRSIAGAFGDDDMRLHHGGGRIVASARRSLGGQVIGTAIRHELRWHHRCTLAIPACLIAVRMVPATVSGPLMSRLRNARRLPATAVVAVDLAAVIGLAEVEELAAAGAANPHENVDKLHAPTVTAALMKFAPPVRLEAPSPRQRPRATRRLRGRTLGLHLSRSR
jgi:hypothetical protein